MQQEPYPLKKAAKYHRGVSKTKEMRRNEIGALLLLPVESPRTNRIYLDWLVDINRGTLSSPRTSY